MTSHISYKPSVILILAIFIVVFTMATRASAVGLNTDVALTPPPGGTIIRIQWRYSELSDDPTPADRDVKRHLNPVTVVHGISDRLAVLATTPIVHLDIDPDPGSSNSEAGVNDITLLAKYRFFQNDKMGETTRWAMLGGARIPTHDDPFSSESLDPIIGTVWTHQTLDNSINWDLIYRLGTGGGIQSDDQLKVDVAYTHTLYQAQSPTHGPWAVYAVAEANANYITDGSTQIFLSPGLQLITPNLIIEAGAQLPIQQNLSSPRLETDFTSIFSIRFQF